MNEKGAEEEHLSHPWGPKARNTLQRRKCSPDAGLEVVRGREEGGGGRGVNCKCKGTEHERARGGAVSGGNTGCVWRRGRG